MRESSTKESEKSGIDIYQGYCIDLLRKIAEIQKFNYTLHEVPDKTYGSKGTNGKWNGLVAELIRGVLVNDIRKIKKYDKTT